MVVIDEFCGGEAKLENEADWEPLSDSFLFFLCQGRHSRQSRLSMNNMRGMRRTRVHR